MADVKPPDEPPKLALVTAEDAAEQDGVGDFDPPSRTFDGEDFLFHLYRGSELLQDNCVSEAKEELERALSMQPRDTEGQGLLGVVYFRLGLYPRAISIYEDIIRACPREVTPRINLALCYFKTGQSVQARDMLEEVIRLVPDHTRAWGYLGLVFERLGEHTKALHAFERAGQPQMVRRMQALVEASEDARESTPPEAAEVRRAAADAVQELDGHSELPAPFERVAELAGDETSPSGHWRAIELGREPMPPKGKPSRRPSLIGRFGPAVPPLPLPLEATGISVLPPAPPPPASLPPIPARNPNALADESLLYFPESSSVGTTPEGLVLVRIQESFASRVDLLHVLLPAQREFASEAARRRFAGRESDEPMVGRGQPLVWLRGAGNLVLKASSQRKLLAIQLVQDFIFLREDHLAGFEGTLRYENGRMTTGNAEHVPMVQLSGDGAVVLEARGTLRAVQVSAERPISLRAEHVWGWTGRLLANPLDPASTPNQVHGFVTLNGDGAVFIETES